MSNIWTVSNGSSSFDIKSTGTDEETDKLIVALTNGGYSVTKKKPACHVAVNHNRSSYKNRWLDNITSVKNTRKYKNLKLKKRK